MARVELRNVKKSFGDAEIIKGVSLDIAEGEFVVIVGPSGCGKSTLLRMIAGLEDITSGELFFDETLVNHLTPAKRKVGMVFQSYALYPHMTVEQNIGFGLRISKTPKSEIKEKVDEALEILQLSEYRDHKPSQLSGGQRQRVAIGRSIVRDPTVFLFDEPLSNLDTALRVQMRLEIGRLHRKLTNTIVYVTHDQVEAMTLADRIVVLELGEIHQVGAPMELYNHPANRFVAGFIGAPKMGFINCELKSMDARSVNLALPGGHEIKVSGNVQPEETDDSVVLGLRPEVCSIGNLDTAPITGEVLELERLGSDTFAFLEVNGADGPVAVRVEDYHEIKTGQRVGIDFDTTRCHLFGTTGASLINT
jgi:multiple sugar transport system ATP-binding protein